MTTTRSRLPPSWRGPLLCTGKRKVRLGLCLSLFCNLKISILKRFNLHVAIWPHVRCSLPCLYYHFCLSVLIHTDSLTAEANWRSPRPKRDMISAKRISRAMWVTFALRFLLTIFSPYWIVYHLRLLWSQKSVFITVHNSSRHFLSWWCRMCSFSTPWRISLSGSAKMLQRLRKATVWHTLM